MLTSPLVTALQAAVPLWIAEADQRSGDTRAELLADWREEAGPVVAYRSDIMLYRGRERGEAAKCFNSLARGLAALSCHQGGVAVFGLLWCAEHSPGGVPTDSPVCARCVERYPDAPRGCTCCSAIRPGPPDEPAYVGPRSVADPLLPAEDAP
jgi:hypothetical protein